LVGQYEKGKKGRSADSRKKLVVVALEILGDKGVGKSYRKCFSGRVFSIFQ